MSLQSARQPAKLPRRDSSGALKDAASTARPWVERLARFGFAAKGVVYFIIGLLALQAATGTGGKTTDATGALRTILQQPFGQVLLGAVAIGLFGYALWRIVQAVVAPGEQEPGVKGVIKRIGSGVSAVAYLLLGFTTIRLLTGIGSGKASREDQTAELLLQPWGPWALGLVGVTVVAVGLYFLYRAHSEDFCEEFAQSQMTARQLQWAVLSGKIGYAARGAVFMLTGYFLIQAALHVNARKVRGLGDVLNGLASQPYGKWLLGAVAIGLIAYAIHMFVAARFRRVWA